MNIDDIRALLNDIESDRVERTISTTNTDKFRQAICAFPMTCPTTDKPAIYSWALKTMAKCRGLT